jgi:D-alanine-D-alanine ligase
VSTPERICLLSGGTTAEASASRSSAAGVYEALSQDGHEVLWLDLADSFEWSAPTAVASESVVGANGHSGRSWDEALAVLVRVHAIELVFPTIHGPIGEDGQLQELCDSLGLPCVGCDAEASAACYDKARFKHIALAAKLPVVPGLEVPRRLYEAAPDAVAASVTRDVGYPTIVKPSRSGSSLGLALVEAPTQLDAAIAHALRFDDVVLVERLFAGLDIEIGVFEDETSATVVGSPVELEFEGLYDFETKYAGDRDVRYLPARFPGAFLDRLRDAARDAFSAAGCSGLARVDLLVAPDTQEFVVNEINTIPYMPASSTFATSLCHATDGTYRDLIRAIVEVAWSRR